MKTQTKLRKRTLTVIEKAIAEIIGFKELYQAFEDKILILGLSSSALNNYARRVAEVCLHFNRLPKDISENELNKYLADMAREGKSQCLSNFKFTVTGYVISIVSQACMTELLNCLILRPKRSYLLFSIIRSVKPYLNHLHFLSTGFCLH
jgi:hypothetical protein